MGRIEYCGRVIQCSKQRLLQVLSDVPNWHRWDPDVDQASILSQPDPLSVKGLKGHLKMKFNAEFDFEVDTVDDNGYFAYKTKHVGAEMIWYWDFRKMDGNGHLVLDEGVEITGFLGSVYGWLLGSKFHNAFEEATLQLKQQCEEQQEQKQQ